MLEDVADAADPDLVRSKCKAINALVPHSFYQERCGQPRMADAISRIAGIGHMLDHASSHCSKRGAVPHWLR
jgi:hypothetical protein